MFLTENAESAVRKIRRRTGFSHLWIDAVWIDLGNNEEKSAQVAMMADIFRSSDSVVFWLDHGSINMARAFGCLRWAHSRFKCPLLGLFEWLLDYITRSLAFGCNISSLGKSK